MNSRTRRDAARAAYQASLLAPIAPPADTVTDYHTLKSGTYYKNAKRATIGGIPCKVPAWYGQLGNDKEYLEAIKPRDAFKAAYYTGAHRMTIDGVPVRLAAYVKDWAPWMKRAIGKGLPTKAESQQLEAQMEILWPAYGQEQNLKRISGMACCIKCRTQYYDNEDGCWNCPKPTREGSYTQAQYDEAMAA